DLLKMDQDGDPEVLAVMNRLSGAKSSAAKTKGLEQAALINNDSSTSIKKIEQLGNERIIGAHEVFGDVKQNINDFFVGTMVNFQESVGNFQASVADTVSNSIMGIEEFVFGYINNALVSAVQFQSRIIDFVSGSVNSLSTGINNISNSILNRIDSISLPDLPGIG